MLALAYVEDSRAEVDMNVVISGSGQMIEVQATAERTPFGRASLDELLSLAAAGIDEISALQTRVLHEARTGVAYPAQGAGVRAAAARLRGRVLCRRSAGGDWCHLSCQRRAEGSPR